jgi:DNA-binding CsgD family transcriptional regulator
MPRSPRLFLATTLVWEDRFDEARALLESLVRQCEEKGDEMSLPVVLRSYADLEWCAGNWTAAFEHAARARKLATDNGQQTFLALALGMAALVEAHLGRDADARATAAEGFELCARCGVVGTLLFLYGSLAVLELAEERPAPAHEIFGGIAASISQMGIADPSAVRLFPGEVEALASLGAVDEAEALLRPFEARAGELGRRWALAASLRCRGIIADARGDHAAAAEILDQAVADHRALGMPFELGRTLLLKGEVGRRARQKRSAREDLQECVDLFDEVGATRWALRGRRALATIGGRVAQADRLTPAEQRVADLAAAGHSNHAIAQRLFISVNTVQTTLRRVFAKTGVHSRTELAVRLAARTDDDTGGA